MRKKIDYEILVDEAVESITEINHLAKEFSIYEMTEAVQYEIDDIIKISDIKKETLKGTIKEKYSELFDIFTNIEDDLSEIDMVTGELIKDVNKKPQKERDTFYNILGIPKIEKEDQGISDDRLTLLDEMYAITKDMLNKCHKYFSSEKEEFVDYEDEAEN